MPASESALALVFALAGVVAAGLVLYLVLLVLAARLHRAAGAQTAPVTQVAVLVPAHDEAALIARCVRSLREQRYPEEGLQIVVIADNCGDDTAARAASAGAHVLVRHDTQARGKGHALRWGFARVLRDWPDVDAIAVVDADTLADPAWLSTLVRPFEAGAPAVQGESLLIEDGTPRTALRVAAFLLINRVRPAGRAVLGLPCSLCGNGMLLGRRLLEQHPWEAFTSTEDLEYAIALRRAGIGPVFAAGAILRSDAAPDARSAAVQQLRWEGGKLHLARSLVPRLLLEAGRERRPGLLDLAFELAMPPFGLLSGAVLAGAALGVPSAALGWLPVWALAPWLVALAALPLYVFAGLQVAEAPASAYRAMTRAPLFLAAKVLTVRRLLGFRSDTWVRTARAGTEGGDQG
jgi:1,2-diacylglycerol 3-beta-glucosyltransferase